MELKQVKKTGFYLFSWSLNCTVMELKLGTEAAAAEEEEEEATSAAS